MKALYVRYIKTEIKIKSYTISLIPYIYFLFLFSFLFVDYFKMPPLKIEDETMPVVASTVEEKKTAQNEPKKEYKMEIVWTNLIIHTVLHATALYGLTVEIWRSQWYTLLFGKYKSLV